jgi:alkaline phosphatase D
MKRSSFFFYFLLLTLACNDLFAFDKQIISGPMLGYNEPKELGIWIEQKSITPLSIRYFSGNDTSISTATNTKVFPTLNGYINIFSLSVLPDRKYKYEVINQETKQVLKFNYPLEFTTQSHWLFRKDPPNFKFAIGSCFFVNDSTTDRPGEKYGGGYNIVNSIYTKNPNFMIWLGDNVYTNEADYNSKNGFLYRYSHTRALEELQPLLANTHHYAVWDDHDYGPNDSDRGFTLKESAREVFSKYWLNPTYGRDGKGIFTSFIWGDCEFILLDNRYFRAANKSKDKNKDYFGKEQLEWLRDKLAFSRATFKFVCTGGQILTDAALFENYSTYPEERQRMLNMIEEEKIEGVIFLDGDRHFSEISKLARPNLPPLYDFTCSPLTAGRNLKGCEEKNSFREANYCSNERAFGLIEISGKLKERVLRYTLYDANNKEIWVKEIKEAELRNTK